MAVAARLRAAAVQRQVCPARTTERSPPYEGTTGVRNLHESRRSVQRVGIGNDLHRLAAGRKLVLGGVRIPFAKGPVGHSDGDALAHAICDALLGGAALGDLGRHFPNTSPRWRNASSLLFLRRVRKLLHQGGYGILNVDSTIGLESPMLARFIPRMKKNLAQALGLRPHQVSIKAKTGEGLDAVGRGEAIRADAVALLEVIL